MKFKASFSKSFFCYCNWNAICKKTDRRRIIINTLWRTSLHFVLININWNWKKDDILIVKILKNILLNNLFNSKHVFTIGQIIFSVCYSWLTRNIKQYNPIDLFIDLPWLYYGKFWFDVYHIYIRWILVNLRGFVIQGFVIGFV